MKCSCEELKEWLKTYPPMKVQTDNLNEQLARMKSAEKFPPASDGEGGRGSGTADPMGGRVTHRVDLERKLEKTVRERERKMREIEDVILALPDCMQQQCLWLRYIDVKANKPTPWKDVAMKIYKNGSESHVRSAQSLHNEAMRSILKFAPNSMRNTIEEK